MYNLIRSLHEYWRLYWPKLKHDKIPRIGAGHKLTKNTLDCPQLLAAFRARLSENYPNIHSKYGAFSDSALSRRYPVLYDECAEQTRYGEQDWCNNINHYTRTVRVPTQHPPPSDAFSAVCVQLVKKNRKARKLAAESNQLRHRPAILQLAEAEMKMRDATKLLTEAKANFDSLTAAKALYTWREDHGAPHVAMPELHV
jgi:hypothetical protein